MVAKSCTDKSIVDVLVAIPGNGSGTGGSIVHVSNRLPVVLLISVDGPMTPSCGWEDDDDPSYNPEELYNSNYGGLEDEDEYGTFDEFEEDDYEDDYEEEEEDDDDDDVDDDVEEDVDDDYDDFEDDGVEEIEELDDFEDDEEVEDEEEEEF
ncbi:MAG: hypothetical protein ABIH23_06435 [bacterium]